MSGQQRLSRLLFLLFALFAVAACTLTGGRGPANRPAEPIAAATAAAAGGYPILFVTQPPIAEDFTTIGSTFGNHDPAMAAAGRGGDLWIRYPDGTLKNLTAAAGYGSTDPDGFQGADSIAVRDPEVHWDGQKAVFSMVIGAPTEQYVYEDYYWQLYEISGLGRDDTPVITKVANQPEQFNNVSPIYGSDDQIIFISDRPRDGSRHLYPQLDEYEEAPTNTGVWRLDPTSGALQLLHHAPSGSFTPVLDSYGRVLFTNWDHLVQDQQAYDDNLAAADGDELPYGTFNYSDESAAAVPLFADRTEVFPEPRFIENEGPVTEHDFNHFFPWQVREDGTESEVLNHLGRHELHSYFEPSFRDDPALIEFSLALDRFNANPIANMFHIAEDPTRPGVYFGVDTPEFGTHSAGYIFSLAAPPGKSADAIAVTYITDPENGAGRYREPLVLADGTLVAVYTPTVADEDGSGPDSDYAFRLVTLAPTGDYWMAGAPLTAGIARTIRFWSPDDAYVYNGNLWELNPVEVRPRPRPAAAPFSLPAPEQQILDEAGVDLAALQAYLRANNLALVVSRDVTRRDDADRQQPFNLVVANGGAQTSGVPGQVYEIAYMQFLQGDQIRGLTGCCGQTEPGPGRRVLAQFMHDPAAVGANPPVGGPAGSVLLAADGSMAAFVPAGRAMTWQLVDPAGNPVVRERYWLTFQPGEVRVCANCHGLNELDQAGASLPENPPQALLALLRYWVKNQ